ncbi:MAG: DUF5684 domain-containing protein [bacterium]|nr:DUF5684 domain-containing protein [bacterium]
MPEFGGTELAIVFGLIIIPSIVFGLFYGYCTGRVFKKAGRELWEGFVPFYNWYVWIVIVGRPTWWTVLLFIPGVNAVIQIFLAIDMARSFGKDEVFGVLLLWLLAFIGVPILAFGNDKYIGPSVQQPNSLVQS